MSGGGGSRTHKVFVSLCRRARSSEHPAGIEPAHPAWHAGRLPLHHGYLKCSARLSKSQRTNSRTGGTRTLIFRIKSPTRCHYATVPYIGSCGVYDADTRSWDTSPFPWFRPWLTSSQPQQPVGELNPSPVLERHRSFPLDERAIGSRPAKQKRPGVEEFGRRWQTIPRRTSTAMYRSR